MALNVLRTRLPGATGNIQFVRSRTRQPPGLYSLVRFASGRSVLTLSRKGGGRNSPSGVKLESALAPKSYGFLTFFRSRTNVDLNDSGDTVRLLDPDGRVVDQTSYLKVRASNLSYGRLPDGGHHLRYGLWPTAGLPNQLFIESKLPLPILDDFTCPAGHLRPLLFRFPDHPLARLHASTPLFVCP